MVSDKESEILFNLIKFNYGDKISKNELGEVKKAVDNIVKTSKKLRMIQLSNWDEPFSVFVPFRED